MVKYGIVRHFMLLCLMVLLPQLAQASDWMHNSSKFSMSSSSDHVTFKPFLCDLDRSDTYAKKGGIYAKCGNRTVWLMDIHYKNEGDNGNPYGKVYARYCVGEARAWFTNGFGQAEQKIEFDGKDFLIQKWGSDNHYCTPNIDFYYPASMAGNTWTFYYEYEHNNGGTYTMTLGSAYLNPSIYSSYMPSYEYERSGPDKIKFTVPALPDDVPSKLSEVHKRVGEFTVTASFTRQDNTVVNKTETFESQKGSKKTYEMEIPSDVGNPKKIDMTVAIVTGVKDARNYYWKQTYSYGKTDVFPVVPVPNSLTTEFRQFDNAADLSWNAYPSGSNNYLECKPYIYRMETDKDGKAKSGSWSKRGTVDDAGTNQTLGYHDNSVNGATYYKYMVLNVPKDWIGNGINESQLNSPSDDLLNRLGYVESELMNTQPELSIYDLRQDTTVTNKVKLTWQYTRIPTSASSVTFKVMRKTSDDSEWAEFGTVNGDAQPSAGKQLSFTDGDLPNPSVRYQYKVRLTLNSTDFESDAITAGLLNGSSVKKFSATKGTHAGTVRLSWEANQVGTDNTTFVISRRYVNSEDEYIRINTTSGTNALYTYEDNTVQPGYYYEYKIEAYNGNLPQNSLTDAGFCQARGVISGRISFGSGDAVEDVRLTLRPSNADDGNTVKGYSQRVDGASTGIAWDVDETELAKVFGKDKDYTVQMFVRPDEGMQEGAVIGEIPGVGRLRVGARSGDSYQLLLELFSDITVSEKTFTEYWRAEGCIIDTKAEEEGRPGYQNDTYGTHIYTTEEDVRDARTNIAKKLGLLYYDYRGNWISDIYGGTDYYMSLYYVPTPLPEPITLKMKSWTGILLKTELNIPANIYSLISVQNAETVPVITVNDKSAQISLLNLVSSKEYTNEEDIALDPKYRIFDNRCLYSIDGVNNDALMEFYEREKGYGHGNENKYFTTSCTTSESMAEINPKRFAVGGAEDITEEEAFKGNFTEVRVWNHTLSDKEKSYYQDRVLNGREDGLLLYWPMDEGLDHYVFDASYANDLPNGRHATVGNNIAASNIVPLDNQLSRYAITNATGEYIIRGIPFVGSGSTYTILPTRGIHEFNPVSRNGFIGSGSLTLNSYDFTDTSSFPLRGKITYLNTDIPVDSVQFMIDGNMVQSKEGIRSDSNGEYEISVPIGNHLIECYKNGHKFTSFPLDGSTYDFKKAEIANFVDSTLVNVTGRVNGGISDLEEPLGFKRSVNRLGKATIKLSLGKESQCSFNYVVDSHGDGNYGTVDIPVESATDSIQSTAYRAALKDDNTDTYYIYITTDEKTGEFSAMLPPLKYKVESITFDNDKNGDIYNDKAIFAQNLPVIDATNTVKEQMQTDSIAVEGSSTLKYEYSAKMIRQYRANPTLSVEQTSPLLSKTIKNVFGEGKIGVTNVDFTVDSVAVANITDNSYDYTFGHPIFQQDKTYTYDIAVAENYKNLDTGETFTEVPTDAVVHIANDASSTTIIYAEDGKVNGEDVNMGQPYKTANIEITPDETGHIQYQFVAGAPNFATGYLHNMSVGVAVDGRTTMWQAPDSQTEALDLIVLGSIGSGTNFVTRGPDAVDMIIRRPPGSTSVASLTNKTIRSFAHTTVESSTSGWTGGGYISETPTWEVNIGPVLGIATLAKSKFKVVVNQTLKATRNYSDQDIAVNDTTYTVTEQMVTPSSMVIDLSTMSFAPEGGDTYIGRSTNLLFSKGRMLGIYKQDNGTYQLDVKNGVTVGQEFDTEFVFPQAYIENTLIPNWEALIKSKLEEGYINGDHWDKTKAVAVPGKVIYYTKYKPGDPEFGRPNYDKSWTKEQLAATHGYPSYMAVNGTDDPNVPDEVEDAINQIKVWRDRIADNEEDKLDAFNDEGNLIENYSIASGTKVSQTTETSIKGGKSHKHDFSKSFSVVGQIGETFNDAGAIANLGYSTGEGNSNTDGSSTTVSNSVAWTMSDGDVRTALSVDVYKSPSGWGPIFRTRGGQTANPYEGASYTKYYQPGTLLNEATMKVENPKLKVKGATEVTDVPTGTEAKFILQLFNESETNDICNYVLQVKEKSNPNGAILMIDGMVLSNGKEGRLIKMKGGEMVEKTLFVSQSDRTVIDYNDIIIQLKSEKDPTIESDPVTLRVHFVPASSPVSLSVDHTVLNEELKRKNGGVVAKMYDLDRQDAGLKGLRLRYRRKGTDTWTVHKQWTTIESLLSQGYEAMPDGSQFTEKVTFPADGIYELQAQSFGKYGGDNGEDVTFESEIIDITQDTHGPKILGMVSPENGQLTYVNRNNMHLRFNEKLNVNALSRSGNFRIEGGMNNVVFGEGAYPDVAVQLNGSRIQTEAQYDLSNSSYAFDMWFYRQGDGTIVSLGTEDNLLSLATHDDGMLQARVGGEDAVFDTNTRLPKDQWVYMAMNYKRKTADDPQNRITMLYVGVDDKTPNYIGQNMPANDLNGHGKLSVGGDGMQGMVAELSIWNTDVTANELYQTRHKNRAAYTPGLVGYWEMDEGHGTQLTDRARSRHMYMDSESWYINNENRALALDGTQPMRVDIATFSPAQTDNYAIEFWFRGNKPCDMFDQTLLSVLNGYTIGFQGGTQGGDILTLKKVKHSHNEAGAEIQEVEEEIQLSNKDYKDGNWHHFALNVRRGTSAIAYIDGEAVKVIPEDKIPGLSAKWMLFGGEELMDTNGNEYAMTYSHFTGDIDEIRIWSAALDGQLIKDRMYERMDNSYPGLVGYFPMESIHRNEQGTVVTDFSLDNFGETDYQQYIVIAEPQAYSQSVNAPALKPGSTNMRLDDSQFDFTASADEIYFTFKDNALALMDNNDFVATVNYIKDEHGNNSETVQWKFHADFAAVGWELEEGKAMTDYEKNWDVTAYMYLGLTNKTGVSQPYEITGLPTWLTVDEPVGTVDSEEKYLRFTIAPTVSIGRHTEYIYVTDRLGIQRVLQLNVTVRGNEPNWTVDPNLYESNMMLTGQIYIEDKICENTDTKLAVFDDMGLCRGVAHPRYVSSRDAYYVDMIIYGGSATELSTGERELSFKMYNASTGNIHPLVFVSVPGMDKSYMTYVPDASYGSYDDPVRFTTTNIYQQPISLARGWTWMSIYVDPILTNIESVLPKDATILKRFKNIKSKTAFASVNAQGQILGELKDIEPGKMYKMQLASKTDFDVYGVEIDVKETPQTIYPGYNWIGSLSERVLSPNDAFAELNPTPGDRVKNRTSFAEYSKNGIWEGTLESIVPGEGYIYRSMATEAKTFHYPSGQAFTAQAREATLNPQPSTLNLQTSHYTPMDDNLYPDNMNIIAVVKKNGAEVDNAEVAGFINGECRGAVSYNKGYYFLTVLGSSEDDANSKLAIKVWVDGEEYVVDNSLPFISDAFYGSLEEPYVLDIDATAISTVELDDEDDDDWYTLQGLKIGRRPTQQGIYIHKGKTVAIKFKK